MAVLPRFFLTGYESDDTGRRLRNAAFSFNNRPYKAGALDNARDLLEDESFLIVNGKIISDIDIAAAVKTQNGSGALATIVLKPNVKREKFTIVETEDGHVTGLSEMARLRCYPAATE